MKTIEKIDKMIDEVTTTPQQAGMPKGFKMPSPTKFKWAGTRAKDIGSWVDDLKEDLMKQNINGVLASLGVIKNLVETIERGLGIKGIK
jgi:hypothetical protein